MEKDNILLPFVASRSTISAAAPSPNRIRVFLSCSDKCLVIVSEHTSSTLFAKPDTRYPMAAIRPNSPPAHAALRSKAPIPSNPMLEAMEGAIGQYRRDG